MPKAEWGVKRLCHSCGTQYYDFQKPQPVCPKCGAEYAPENTLKISRGVPEDTKKKPSTKTLKEEDIAVLEEDDDEESYIEDPEELGDDGDVIEVSSDEREDS